MTIGEAIAKLQMLVADDQLLADRALELPDRTAIADIVIVVENTGRNGAPRHHVRLVQEAP